MKEINSKIELPSTENTSVSLAVNTHHNAEESVDNTAPLISHSMEGLIALIGLLYLLKLQIDSIKEKRRLQEMRIETRVKIIRKSRDPTAAMEYLEKLEREIDQGLN